MFRLPVVDPLFPLVYGTVDEYPEPAKLDVCIAEDPLHIAALLRRPVLQDPVPVHLELKDAAMEDTIVEEHLRAAIGDRAAQVRCAIGSWGCRLGEREGERQSERKKDAGP